MNVRAVCAYHKTPLENVGNGRVLYPTDSPHPNYDDRGWYQLDTSEMSCPHFEIHEDCRSGWKWEVKTTRRLWY